jgi:DNA-binding SARP family transcriptional activator
MDPPAGEPYRFRSRKSWAVLAYLLLAERPPSRARLADLLFAEADDPLRALRWSLAEIRRGLGDAGQVEGDPVVVDLGPGGSVDATLVATGSWEDAVRLPGLGCELLEGIDVHASPAFDSWLLAERQRLAAASGAVLHEAALAAMSRGTWEQARDLAVRGATLDPLDEDAQVLLVRLYRLTGQDRAAAQQAASFARALDRELGAGPGPAVAAALHERPTVVSAVPDEESIGAVLEAGGAAVAAGAVDAGLSSLRTAVGMADRADAGPLRTRSRLLLAETLVHGLRGLDEEGLTVLHEADRIAVECGDATAAASARTELGYVNFLRARYDRAERWLSAVLDTPGATPAVAARATTYLGAVASDRADYPRALALLEEAADRSRAAGEPRREAYARSLLGRAHLLRGELGPAETHLEAAIDRATRDHWLSFLPWPEGLRGEVHLVGGDPAGAGRVLRHAFARARQLGDPCWEGLAARGLALVAEADGDPGRAFALLTDARTRTNRFADSYVWLDVHILDARCTLGRRHGHPDTARWVATMRTLAARTAMRELTVRALLHGAALGRAGDAAEAALLSGELDNPRLAALLDDLSPTSSAPGH